MSFRWTRQGDLILSTCTACPWTNQDRHEPTLLRAQRAHTPDDCHTHREAVKPPPEFDYVTAARQHAACRARVAREKAAS